MFVVGSLTGFNAGGSGAPPVITFRASEVSSSPGPVTFTDVPIGTASGDRFIIVVGGSTATDNRALDLDVKIDNVSMTRINHRRDQGSTTAAVGLFGKLHTTGTTANVIITSPLAEGGTNGIGLWTVTGLKSTTARSSNTALDATGSPLNLNLEALQNAIVVAGVCARTGSGRTYVWTGVTEQYDESQQGGVASQSGGHTQTLTSGLVSISCDPSGEGARIVAVSGTWR